MLRQPFHPKGKKNSSQGERRDSIAVIVNRVEAENYHQEYWKQFRTKNPIDFMQQTVAHAHKSLGNDRCLISQFDYDKGWGITVAESRSSQAPPLPLRFRIDSFRVYYELDKYLDAEERKRLKIHMGGYQLTVFNLKELKKYLPLEATKGLPNEYQASLYTPVVVNDKWVATFVCAFVAPHEWSLWECHFAQGLAAQLGNTLTKHQLLEQTQSSTSKNIEATQQIGASLSEQIKMIPGCNNKALTGAQKEVLFYVVRGMTNQEIADTLHCTARNVAQHITNMHAKLGLHNRVALTRWAMGAGEGR